MEVRHLLCSYIRDNLRAHPAAKLIAIATRDSRHLAHLFHVKGLTPRIPEKEYFEGRAESGLCRCTEYDFQ